ncbi:HIT family protein [soil metagenome]
MGCELCEQSGGEVLHRNEGFRVVLLSDADYPGFCRVVCNQHVKEMGDLSPADRNDMMTAVWKVEAALRDIMQPDKINLASLGNMTPHLHWHVIPRYVDDKHFPNPVWANPVRVATPESLAARSALLPELRAKIASSFAN